MRWVKAALILAVPGFALSAALESQAQSSSRGGAAEAVKAKRKSKSSSKSTSKSQPETAKPARATSEATAVSPEQSEAARAAEFADDEAARAALSGEPDPAAPAPLPAAPISDSAPAAPPLDSGSAAAPAPGSDAPPVPEEPAARSPLQLSMFVDAYAAWQSSGSGTLATLSGHRAFSGQGATLRAENGFALAFLGFDASYQTQRFGATASLRFGEGASIYHSHADGESDLSFGVDHLTQAYLTWRPVDPLALNLGMFPTPFGVEVESWKNLNYTRGALYYYAQPAWHTGLRLTWNPTSALTLTGFVADGTNIASETQQNSGLDQTPTVGAQVGISPASGLSLLAGGLFTLDSYHNDDAGFDALADVVASLELGGFRSSVNADFILTRNAAPSGSDRHFFGFSVAAGYAFNDAFGVAARGEWLRDDANFDAGDQNSWRLFTVTLTTDFKPLPHTPNLILRWDNRWEASNQDIFGADAKGTADIADDTYDDVWFESVIGVVVTTAP